MKKIVENVFEGDLQSKGLRFAIVCARFNEFFVSKLLDGAVDAIVRHGGKADAVDVAWVPGSYEIPLAAAKLAKSAKYDAIIALGVVIQGATPHASLITAEVNKCLAQISLDNELPVINGVLATTNIEQAIERSGTKAGNRGGSAAATAIEMVNLIKNL
ncbi:MAG: 6,7-dimethyl-8-ribityllumazine synthase [Kiritimatiellaeota bacterium]|nr:6,7-dimethyl-8-ribityllumazine synthase [Kiritimatiellota bacterium]